MVWFWRTEASPILSFLIHAVRWGATIPEGRQEPSAILEEGKKQTQKKAEKKRRAQGLDRFGTSRKKRRIILLIFQWKNVFIWSLSHSEERNSPGNYPNPSVETISYREKSWNQAHTHTQTHTHSDTLTHTRLNMWTQKQQRPKSPKIKTVRLAHPQQQRMKQFYISDRNQKKILARLSNVVPTKKYKQWPKIYKFTWCHIGAQIKLHWWTFQDRQMHLHSKKKKKKSNKKEKKTFMMTRD